eukprot:gene9990-10856_t
MNTSILFLIGVVLGILVSVSVLQNDLVGRLFGQSGTESLASSIRIDSKVGDLTLSTQQETDTAKEETLKDVKNDNTPIISEKVTQALPSSLNTQAERIPSSMSQQTNPPEKDLKKPTIKWAPGKEMNFQKYIEHAETAQKHIFGENVVKSGSVAQPMDQNIDQKDDVSSPLARKKQGMGKMKRGKDSSLKRKDLGPAIASVNSSEQPIELENQLKLYKKLKKKEGMFVGDNDEDPTAAIVNAVDEAANDENTGKKGGKRKKGLKTPEASTVLSSISASVKANLTNGNGLPPIPYHGQVQLNFSSHKPLVISYEQAVKLGRPLPDMTRQKAMYEKENLKIHLCNAVFEAYSASYLTTKEHMLAVASESYNLSWVNCEMASFIHMKESNRFYKSPNHHGVIMQSLDVLDFSVIHLSAFERSSLKHRFSIWEIDADRRKHWSNIDAVVEAGRRLEALNNPLKRPRTRKVNYSPEAKDTVVVMPFLGGAMGAGHSKLNNRFEYLKTCFWSLYEFFPNIVISVTRQEDVDWGWKDSGLPFFDIILITGLPKSASLPVATTQQTKIRLKSGQWNFSYVFFSESDQILISRELPLMYDHLKRYPGHMMLPHRLMPYSSIAITKAHKRDISQLKENDWMHQSCCMPRQNCMERTTWKNVKDPVVPMINYYGLYVPLGNINFLKEDYRYCNLTPYIGDYCP